MSPHEKQKLGNLIENMQAVVSMVMFFFDVLPAAILYHYYPQLEVEIIRWALLGILFGGLIIGILGAIRSIVNPHKRVYITGGGSHGWGVGGNQD